MSPLTTMDGDMDGSACDARRKVAIYTFWNRIMGMSENVLN